MAAGHQKKRLSASSVVSCNLQEQYRVKKKKSIESSKNLLSMKPHIFLEWDDYEKKAVAKKEQIAITLRDMSPYTGSVSHGHSGLADVIPVPHEIFELDNLTGVLSYQVWKKNLSESERQFLTQFLPQGDDVDLVLKPLFGGQNFHFGNSFLEWGSSVCSRAFHPDAVIHCEKCLTSDKKTYYEELQKYHSDMLECLQMWKKRWISCKDPEKEIVQKQWRYSRNHEDKRSLPQAMESRSYELEENVAATADSCSWIPDKRVPTNKKRVILGKRNGEAPVRKGSSKCKNGSALVPLDGEEVVNNSKAELSQNDYVHTTDVFRYMSYFKISKKQHEEVKKIKQSGDGIQSKSLNRVLGDLKKFHVEPYELFEEEQSKKLRDRWLQLVRKDLPTVFAHWGEMQLQRQLWRKSLRHELAETGKKIIEEMVEGERCISLIQGQTVGETGKDATVPSDNDEDGYVCPSSHGSQPLPLERIPSLNSRDDQPDSMDSEEANKEILEQEANLESSPQNLEKIDPPGYTKADASSAKSVWSTANVPDSYTSPSVNHGYASAGELSLSQPQPMEGQTSRVIDLEAHMVNPEVEESILQRSCNEVESHSLNINVGALFGSYPTHDRNSLFQPFQKEERMLQSYSNNQISGYKQQALQFFPTNDGSSKNGQFPGQFQEQQRGSFDLRQMMSKEMYMHQLMDRNVYSNGHYSNQELFPPVGMQDWISDSSRAGSLQTPINASMLASQNWFSGETRVRSGWSSSDVPSSTGQCLGGVAAGTDGSLYSVLPQYNQLQPRPPLTSMSSDYLNAAARSIIGGGISVSADCLPYPSQQLNYIGSCEPSAVNMQHSNSSLHDPMGRPFLRSWNQ